MTREEAVHVLEDGLWWQELDPDMSEAIRDELDQALDMAISALRAQQDNPTGIEAIKPLSLEELRKMAGEPVWIEPIDSCPPHWRIWTNSEPFDMAVFKAYRRKPEEGVV